MAQLHDYLHTAVPTPLMDAGVEVVDLHDYVAKIDHEFKTQRYDDIDVPLLYIHIQIGEATCIALVDCGATRNYMSQNFMVRAGLGPRVHRKSQPTQVTLADGHTHKSIDRCIDVVLVYFAQHASEAVSFDILDTKFDVILGMSWLRSEDHPLLDAYGDMFDAPHRVVPDRPIHHEIILEAGAVPPRGCIYRMSEEELSVLRAQLGDLLEKGWIRPSSSPYGALVLFVRKKNKDLRLCIDYRKLNAQTVKNAGPLPCIDDLLERLGGAKFFSNLDLKSGYHKLEIWQEDRYKTAFKTRYGHFEWLVMPFGLTNAPTTFQATMTTEFRHMRDRFVLIYLNDILVYSRILDEHVEHLRTVLERLRQAKYKANRDKCEFARQELEYLGHYVTPQGIRSLADKIEAVLLEQHDGDDKHPVEYFSHKVPPINSLDDERKELLAFVMVLKRWRHFLLGRRRFTWVTDNNPLTNYKTQDTVSSTIGRWMYFINQFDFTPKHLDGFSNRATDALSRRPDLCAMTHHAFAFDEELQRHFIRGYESDPDFAMLYAQLSSDHPPASHYRIVDGYFLLHLRGKDLLCVPHDRRLQTRLLGEYHDSRLAGHFGVNRTIARLRQRFRWPDLITDVTRYCDSCEVCRRSKPRNRNPYGQLRPMPIPREPGLSIAMDVTGPFPRDRLGHDGILTVVDCLSALWTRRILSRVLRGSVNDGDLTEIEAIAAGKAILFGNSVRLYGLNVATIASCKDSDVVNIHHQQSSAETVRSPVIIPNQNGYVRMMWMDISAMRRCKAVPKQRYEKVTIVEGMTTPEAVISLPSLYDKIATGCPYGLQKQVCVIPEEDTRRTIPWFPDHEMVLSTFYIAPGKVWESCPRGTLVRMLAQLKEEFNLELYTGFEHEFYLLKPATGPESELRWMPIECSNYASTGGFNRVAPLLSRMSETLAKMGIIVDLVRTFSGACECETVVRVLV
ncbi:hypothetical protein CBR_g51526 [Chara braunii]|uniref:RNA-directed DNA polymerase n=1 Tax=Chara braunii TaxID=69332 RepID=A0A388M8N8_CHABU|nr:hypothetical protein CBR_g51526 [Chara braunii]|eukprot:GBG90921.1 hypothetical protein CBR_g51526 [Chara braunii]